jgi:hypothetical protein
MLRELKCKGFGCNFKWIRPYAAYTKVYNENAIRRKKCLSYSDLEETRKIPDRQEWAWDSKLHNASEMPYSTLAKWTKQIIFTLANQLALWSN